MESDSSNIYQEAIADAKKLKEVAEQNAKNAIVEAVTPRIRELVENELLGKSSDDLDEDILPESSFDNDSDVELSEDSIKTLASLMIKNSQDRKPIEKVELDILRLRESFSEIATDFVDDGKNLNQLEKIKSMVDDTYSRLSSLKGSSDEIVLGELEEKLVTLKESLESILNSGTQEEKVGDLKMTRRRLSDVIDNLNEEDLSFDLTVSVPDDAELDEEDVEVSITPSEEEEVEDTEDAEEEATLEDELPPIDVGEEDLDLGAELDEWFVVDESLLSERGRDSDEDEPQDEGADADDDEDKDEVYDIDEIVRQIMGEEEEVRESSSRLSDDTVVEISESMLRSELSRMRTGEKSLPSQQKSEPSDKFNQMKKQLAEYRKAVSELREQLNEANLFNAKLLYANKLLQNKGLSSKQKVSVVESLDRARSLREVRLLYKGLTESLRKGGSKLTESAQRKVLGSASRVVAKGSSSVDQHDFSEANRWAKLAGLNNNK